MSAPFSCSWCAAPFWTRTKLAERPDFDAQGAAARAAGVAFDDCPHPARTWPAILWGRGWLLADLRRAA